MLCTGQLLQCVCVSVDLFSVCHGDFSNFDVYSCRSLRQGLGFVSFVTCV